MNNPITRSDRAHDVTKTIRTSLLLGFIFSLAGCGGDGSSATTQTTSSSSNTPTAPIGASLSTSGKSLDFSWTAGNNVDHYRILVNPDGMSGFTVDPAAATIAGTATSHSIEIATHKTNWLAAEYIVEACDATETVCEASPNLTLALIDSVAATLYMKASNPGADDDFGWSVAVSGDGNTLAVSARFEDSNATGIDGDGVNNSASNAGAVYVFTKVSGAWSQQAYVKASNAGVGDQFGTSISLSDDGNTLAVGAISEDSNATGIGGDETNNSAQSAGAAYLFTRTAGVWSQQAYVKASNTDPLDAFGFSVSLSGDGDTLAVGAYTEDSNATGVGGSEADNSQTNPGAVYLFTRTTGTWSQQAYVKASTAEDIDLFGYSVALNGDGNTLAVGASNESSVATGIGGDETSNAATGAGAVYVFTRTGGVWSQQAYVKASNTGQTDRFGSIVSISDDGNTLAVGAYQEDSNATGINGAEADNSAGNAGAVYVFTRTSGTWSQQAYVKASNTAASDWFGLTISLSDDGNTLAVGALLEDSNVTGINGDETSTAASGSGAAYVFTRVAGVWSQLTYVKASNTAATDNFGRSISISGDANTLAVSANLEDSNATGVGGDQADNSVNAAGAVYMY
jgi:hypothetical protein